LKTVRGILTAKYKIQIENHLTVFSITRQVPPALDSSTSSVSGNSSKVKIYHKPFAFIALLISGSINFYPNAIYSNPRKHIRKWVLPRFFPEFKLQVWHLFFLLLLPHLDFETEYFIK